MTEQFIPVGETIKVRAVSANDLRVGDRLLSTAWLATSEIESIEFVAYPERGPRHFKYRVVGQPFWDPARTLRWDDVVGVVVDTH